jgi:predicted metal-dependent HD superfamily phosphohydrolase
MIDELKRLSPMELPDSVWTQLGLHYASAGRAYHTLEHVLEVARHAHALQLRGVQWQHPREVFCAALYHDAVYDVGRRDNEARSAALALRELEAALRALEASDQGTIDLALVERLILLTARHGQLDPQTLDAETALFLDCDMAILGSDPDAFERYEAQIAAEYVPGVGAEAYRAGRRFFLQGLLDRARIFLSDHFHARLDAQARSNLRRALASNADQGTRGAT